MSFYTNLSPNSRFLKRGSWKLRRSNDKIIWVLFELSLLSVLLLLSSSLKKWMEILLLLNDEWCWVCSCGRCISFQLPQLINNLTLGQKASESFFLIYKKFFLAIKTIYNFIPSHMCYIHFYSFKVVRSKLRSCYNVETNTRFPMLLQNDENITFWFYKNSFIINHTI